MIIKPRRDLILPRRELILPRSRYCELTHDALMGGGNAATPVPNRLIALHLNNSIVDVMGNATTNYGTPTFTNSPTKFNAYSLNNQGCQIGANSNFILTNHSVRLWVYITTGLSSNSEYTLITIGGANCSIYKFANNSQIAMLYRAPNGSTYYDTFGAYLNAGAWNYLEWGFNYSAPACTLSFNANGGNMKTVNTNSTTLFPNSGNNGFIIQSYSGGFYLSDFEYYSTYSSPAAVPTATFPDHS